ncbi:ADP-forming succinate--CoA ligase subunit beta [Acidimicrobiaceae bacterium]|nr:ADP-forming succinate--CoA ligase subunit beta [Acidimicrobiaceae bacterium]
MNLVIYSFGGVMDLFEYQGKSLYQKFNINHPNSKLIKNLNDLNDPIDLNFPVVVKAQVQVGGRGKAGGIKVAKDINELTQYSEEILGMDIKGHKVEILLLEEASNILEEYYISFTLDRSEKKYLIMLSAKGGMDIEQVAEENPDDLIKFHVSPSEKLTSSTISELINKANLNKDHEESLSEIIENLYLMFTEGDCDLVEVNPLAITDNGVMALDSKVSLDMNAKYKHPYFDDFEQEIPIPESEKNAKEKGLNFIKLDGSVGIIGNGAGLVMSTLDVVAENGGKAANFLDIGGGAKAETVSSALEVLEADQNVKSVLINIFGGITRCDLVAEGIIEATKGKELVWPIIIRLDGTNSLEGLEILRANPNEKIFIEESMDSAAKLAVQKGL